MRSTKFYASIFANKFSTLTLAYFKANTCLKYLAFSSPSITYSYSISPLVMKSSKPTIAHT
jgi:hypothetical protein